MIGVAMRSLAVLLVLIGVVLGVVGPRSAAAAVNAGSGTGIFSAAVGVADLRQLTTSPGVDIWPAPSPDGSRIAFVRDDQQGFDSLNVMRSDGSDQTELWPPAGVFSDALGPPSWSPDGKTLLVAQAVSASAEPRSASLHLIPLDGSAPRTIGPGWEGVTVTGAFSPDGRYVAYQTQSFAFFNGQETVGVIAPGGSWRSFGRGTLATWSPRRDRLAYIASASGLLTVVDPDGRHRWTLRTKLVGGFAWSPDGRQIAFVRKQGGALTLTLARPGSPRLRRVITLPGADTLSWSADGRWLAATTEMGQTVVRPDGSGFQSIIGGWSAVWAPSGHTLAFVGPNGWDGHNLETWSFGRQGPANYVIDQAPAGGYLGVAWSPDGTRLIFARRG